MEKNMGSNWGGVWGGRWKAAVMEGGDKKEGLNVESTNEGERSSTAEKGKNIYIG
jgi:hypothetical protein